MDNESCDQVCKTLVEINSSLIKTLVDKVTEALDHINTSLEVHGKVDEQLIRELEGVAIDIKGLVSVVSDTSVRDLVDLINGIKIVRVGDREVLIDFFQRLSMAVGGWTQSERNAVIDLVENSGGNLLKWKRRLNKVYIIIFTAGITTILSQLGLPDGIMKILSAIFSV